MSQDLSQLFTSVAVLAEFHPQARAVQFWRDPKDNALSAGVVFYQRPMRQREQLEADIAVVATMLGPAALPDYHAFCLDIESIFNGAAPSGPVSQLKDLDWNRFRRVSAYAQYWRSRNPLEVAKLVTFMMAMPIFSRLVSQLIIMHHNATEAGIRQQLDQGDGVYLLGVRRFRELFQTEIDAAYSEAKLLVATFRGTKSDNAAQIVNKMLASIVQGQTPA